MWVSQEYYVLLGCLLAGCLMGLIYDIFSLLRFPFHSAAVDACFDVLFYILVFCISALALFTLNDGKVRFYSLFSLLSGCFLYMRFPSRLFRGILQRVRAKVHKK